MFLILFDFFHVYLICVLLGQVYQVGFIKITTQLYHIMLVFGLSFYGKKSEFEILKCLLLRHYRVL